MKKYKLIINIIGHRLDEEELKEAFELANKHKDIPYHEDYSETGGEGYVDITADIVQVGNNLKLEMIYSGEGASFEERAAKIKEMVETGELQKSLLYESEADIDNPDAIKKADKITATIIQIG